MKDYNKLFADILEDNSFELKDATVDGECSSYFLYDTVAEGYCFPDDIFDVRLGINSQRGKRAFGIVEGADGVNRIEYIGDGDVSEVCSLADEEISDCLETLHSDLAFSSLTDLCDQMEEYDELFGGCYLETINEVAMTNFNTFDEALDFEKELQARAAQDDKEAVTLLDVLKNDFENVRFIAEGDVDKVDLNKVYEIQEARKSKSAAKETPAVERD